MIRPAVPEDSVRLAEIHTFAWRWAYRGIVPDRELFVDRTVAKAVDHWNQMLASGTRVLVWDEVVPRGFVIHGPARDPDAGGAWEVMALYVDPPFVREGGGTALMAAAEQEAWVAGCRRVILWVLEANPRARAFYEKVGYRPDGALKVIEEWGGAVEMRCIRDLEQGEENDQREVGLPTDEPSARRSSVGSSNPATRARPGTSPSARR